MIIPNEGATPPKPPPPPQVGPQNRRRANQIKRKAAGGGKKFVLLLGAGSSISSGVTPTQRLMQELVDKYGTDKDGTLEERFDSLWRSSTPESRRLFLEPYLHRQPSIGYEKLAVLIQHGFFDLAVTFNYDNLLEKALRDINVTPKVVIRGETAVDKIVKLIEEPVPGFTLLKLHGSLTSTDTFLFDQSEMWSYPPAINSLVERLTSRDLIVCGYSFKDLCVQRAFSSEGGAVLWVDPGGAPPLLRPVLMNRHSEQWVIRGEGGKFDRFASDLEGELLPRPSGPARTRLNPFKFLAAYEDNEKDWFPGRGPLRKEVLAKLTQPNCTLLQLIGDPKSGKPSVVRAGVIAHLDRDAFEPIYVRCLPDLDRVVIDRTARHLPQQGTPPTLQAALASLHVSATGTGKPIVLFFDQFERVVRSDPDSEAGWRRLQSLFTTLCAAATPQLRLVFVTAEDKDYYKLVLKTRLAAPLIEVEPLTKSRIKIVLRFLLKKSGQSFDPRIVEALLAKLGGQREGSRPFTLAHLQAICYLLVRSSCTTWERYVAQTSSVELESALDLAITEFDIMNFLEDFPTLSERRLVRSFMRVVPESSKRVIAKFIKDSFADLMGPHEYPEPVA